MLPQLSKTIKRNSIIIASSFLAFILIFNLLLFVLIDSILISVLDSKIDHEIEHVWSSFSVVRDSIIITRSSEFKEKDLVEDYDNSFFVQIYKINGEKILVSENIKYLGGISLEFPNFNESVFFLNTKTKREILRTGYKNLYNKDGKKIGYLQISARRIFLEKAKNDIIYYNIIILPIVILLIILTSIVISKKLLKPIDIIISTAKKISAFELSKRLPIDDDYTDEINQLKITLNNLFERLENQINEIASFTNNASHQLLTPITTIKSELDFILKKYNLHGEAKSSILLVIHQVNKIEKIVSTLLIMARTENNRNINNFIFSFNTILNNLNTFYPNLIYTKKVDEEIFLRGNSEYFTMTLQNLVDNAIKYSPPNSEIKFFYTIIGNELLIKIIDQGIGIPENEKSRVFERFYRAGNAENLGIRGTGLGLSFAKTIINSMNGRIEIEDNIPKGTAINIRIPTMQLDDN